MDTSFKDESGKIMELPSSDAIQNIITNWDVQHSTQEVEEKSFEMGIPVNILDQSTQSVIPYLYQLLKYSPNFSPINCQNILECESNTLRLNTNRLKSFFDIPNIKEENTQRIYEIILSNPKYLENKDFLKLCGLMLQFDDSNIWEYPLDRYLKINSFKSFIQSGLQLDPSFKSILFDAFVNSPRDLEFFTENLSYLNPEQVVYITTRIDLTTAKISDEVRSKIELLQSYDTNFVRFVAQNKFLFDNIFELPQLVENNKPTAYFLTKILNTDLKVSGDMINFIKEGIAGLIFVLPEEQKGFWISWIRATPAIQIQLINNPELISQFFTIEGKAKPSLFRELIALCDDTACREILTIDLIKELEINERLFCEVYLSSDGNSSLYLIKKYNDIIKCLNTFENDNTKIKWLCDLKEAYKIVPDISTTSLSINIDELTDELIRSEYPFDDAVLILSSLKGHSLPLISKIFLRFKYQYPYDTFHRYIFYPQGENTSPFLYRIVSSNKLLSKDLLYKTIYRDLLLIHLQSGENSLINFLEEISINSYIIKKIEEGEDISNLEKVKAENLISQLQILLSMTKEIRPEFSMNSVRDQLLDFKQRLKLDENISLSEYIISIFLKPIGFNSIEEAINFSSNIQTLSDKRNRELNPNSIIQTGDLIKAVHSEYLLDILQQGILSKEFYGLNPDNTPLGADFLMVQNSANQKNILATSLKFGEYGDISLICDSEVKKVCTRDANSTYVNKFPDLRRPSRDVEMYTFPNNRSRHGENESHVDIRTGLPSTAIKAIVIRESFWNNEEKYARLIFDVASSNIFIPIFKLKHSEDGSEVLEPVFAQTDYDTIHQQMSLINADTNLIEQLSNVSPYIRKLYEKKSIDNSSIKEHTQEVLQNYHNITVDISNKDTLNELFLMGLALHDIGKGIAFEKDGNTKNQHFYSKGIIIGILNQIGYSHKEIQLMLSIFNTDILGEYMKNSVSPEITKILIERVSLTCGMDSKTVFELMQKFYKCDAGSYNFAHIFKISDDRTIKFTDEALHKLSLIKL